MTKLKLLLPVLDTLQMLEMLGTKGNLTIGIETRRIESSLRVKIKLEVFQ